MKKIINIKELMVVVAVVGLGAFSVMHAAPTALPPGGNIPRPIHTIASSTSQFKSGILSSGDLVRRAISFGSTTPPVAGSNKTVSVTGAVQVGTLSSSSDAFASASDSSESGMTTVCGSTAPCNGTAASYTDGSVSVSSLTGNAGGTTTLCIQQVTSGSVTRNLIVPC